MIIKLDGFNFQNIKNMVEAAEKLQEAGQSETSKKILSDLASEILKWA